MHLGVPEGLALSMIEAADQGKEPVVALATLATASSALLDAGVSVDLLSKLVGDAIDAGGLPTDAIGGFAGHSMPPTASAPGQLPAGPPGQTKR
jgi:hypothetical protein